MSDQYTAMDKSDQLINDKVFGLISDFTKMNSDIQGQIVITFPSGIPIATTWQGNVDPILIGAIAAAVKLTFHRLCENLKRGNLKRLYVNNENGKIIIQNAGLNAILITITPFDAEVNSIAFLANDLSRKIESFMKNYKSA